MAVKRELDANLRHPSVKRAKAIDQDPPFQQLVELAESQSDPKPRRVLHWFRKDLRAHDNTGLFNASKKANGSLLTCFLYSPKDMQWHGCSQGRSDFVLEGVKELQAELKKLEIPLVPLTAGERKLKIDTLVDFIKENDISHIYANYEYEIDEIRRDMALIKRLQNDGLDAKLELYHDETLIPPLDLKSRSGGPLKVFTPYHRAWLAEIKADPSVFKINGLPEKNKPDETVQELLNKEVPSAEIDSTIKERHRKYWPAGHEAATERLAYFIKTHSKEYGAKRSDPAADVTSRLSPYFATGMLSIREAVGACAKKDGNLDSGDGIAAWVRELAFRDFYRQIMVSSPHDAMNLPHNLKFESIEWEDDQEGWTKWCEGKLGVPFVDAGMRQLAHEGWMHNRLRMNVSSYLRTNLLIDYRRGERFFAEHLIDFDLCNNTQGWEPSWTVFNPVLQGEKCDPHGDYIRKWVPELKSVKGKAIFDPYNRLSKQEFEKLGYPAPHVNFAETKERCMERYRASSAQS